MPTGTRGAFYHAYVGPDLYRLFIPGQLLTDAPTRGDRRF